MLYWSGCAVDCRHYSYLSTPFNRHKIAQKYSNSRHATDVSSWTVLIFKPARYLYPICRPVTYVYNSYMQCTLPISAANSLPSFYLNYVMVRWAELINIKIERERESVLESNPSNQKPILAFRTCRWRPKRGLKKFSRGGCKAANPDYNMQDYDDYYY